MTSCHDWLDTCIYSKDDMVDCMHVLYHVDGRHGRSLVCVCVHAYMYYSKYAYMYVCMYVCMHVCMYVCVCMCVCVYSESGPHKFVLGIR